MYAVEHEGQQLHACGSCGGLYVRHDTLVAVANDQQQPRPQSEHADALAGAGSRVMDQSGPEVRRCPACAAAMRRYVYGYSSGVVVDGCTDHGIWLDAGELQRIEAWTEASAGTTPTGDASDAPVDDGIPSEDPFAALERSLPRSGVMASSLAVARSIATSRASKVGAGEAMMLARARAEADAAPAAGAPGVTVVAASQAIECRVDDVWPRLARPVDLVGWMTGLDRARVTEGLGSGRTQRLEFAHDHVVVQRVSSLHPGARIAWVDVSETLQGLEVPPWHDGCWTELSVEPAGDGCQVTWQVTFRAADEHQQARIDERRAPLHAWMIGSLCVLAEQAGMQQAA